MGISKKVVFKRYAQNQISLLPPSLDDLIAQNHPVRVVNNVIDRLDVDVLLKKYQGGGASSYHPRLMLKILVYGYLNNVFSSRKLEEAVQQNIHYMWLAGMEKPDHNTINRFRSEKLKGIVKEVFSQVVLMMVDTGHLDLKHIYVDGTTLEANANRYTFVWGKSVKRNKERIKSQLQELWDYTQKVAAEELQDCSPVNFENLDPQKVEETITAINQALKDKPVDQQVKKKLSYARKNWPGNLRKYEEAEQILAGRNSYSKTDHDAIFMKMKEDHQGKGQLKPGYNVQISTQDQIIANYSLHQTTNDTTTLPEHLEAFHQLYNRLPEQIIADAGYGSQENYEILENNKIDAYVKYNLFERDTREVKSDFHEENLYYNEEGDFVVCPMGQRMERIGEKQHQSTTGYKRETSIYQARNCNGCPLRGVCHTQEENRVIEINHKLAGFKRRARERLLSEEGIRHRKQRCVDVEPVFAMIKHNKGFRRFFLRSKVKVEIEFGLLAIAHNLSKWAKNALYEHSSILNVLMHNIRLSVVKLLIGDNVSIRHGSLQIILL